MLNFYHLSLHSCRCGRLHPCRESREMQDNGMSLVGVLGVAGFTRRVCNHEWYFTSEGLLV